MKKHAEQKSPPKHLSIGQLAKLCGVGVETIRYYQRRALLPVPEALTGIRHYDEQHAARLDFIRRAQSVGFSLAEIESLLGLNENRDHATARQLAKEKIADIENRIDHLQKMADSLRQLVSDCTHHGDAQPCPIIGMTLNDNGKCCLK